MVDTYFNRVPMVRILEPVRETKGVGNAQLLDHLKKDEMASEADSLQKGSDWSPEDLCRNDLPALADEDHSEGQGADVDVEVADSVS